MSTTATLTLYRTGGRLTAPVNDYTAATAYLRHDDMTAYLPAELVDVVFHVEWNLTDDAAWEVEAITTRPLTPAEGATLSEWISGQNSDGLGEGFEQQRFAEVNRFAGYDDEDDFEMASFDWQDNPCTLELVKGGER